MPEKLIFFVDDDKMMINLMEYTFKGLEGIQVKSFFSGEACLEHMVENPDIVVLDYYLADVASGQMSGFDTLKAIRAGNPETKVIILSREKSPEKIEKFIACGAKKYVVKDKYFINTLADTLEELG